MMEPGLELKIERQVTAQLVSAFVFWRLDYCNSVLRFVTSHLSYLNSLDYIFTFLSHSHHRNTLNSLICADVPLRKYSLSLFWPVFLDPLNDFSEYSTHDLSSA